MSLNTVKPQAKYGLIKKLAPPSKRAVLKSSSMFKEELDDDESGDMDCKKHDARADIQRVNKSLMEKQTKDATASTTASVALDIYDYDGYLDDKEKSGARGASSLLSSGSANLTSKSKAAPTATYVHNLKNAAVIREKEKDRIFERKLIKEREQEESKDGVGGADEMKFVTSAYKKKMMEQKKWEQEDRYDMEY